MTLNTTFKKLLIPGHTNTKGDELLVKDAGDESQSPKKSPTKTTVAQAIVLVVGFPEDGFEAVVKTWYNEQKSKGLDVKIPGEINPNSTLIEKPN